MKRSGKSEAIIEEIAGCGKFQITVVICVYFLCNSSPSFTTGFMSFGNYNPGWTCKSSTSFNISETHNRMLLRNINGTLTTEHSKPSERYRDKGSCQEFETCESIEFNPESSTIVSEWGLVCNKKWIPPIMISFQMAGFLLGNIFAGHFGDAVGRKATMYSALLVLTCFNIISLFSYSWQMYTILRFLQGLSSSCVVSLYMVFTVEFVPNKWRSFLIGLPVWNISIIIFSAFCMYFKDWRSVQIITIIMGIVGLIPAMWIPESLRFLEVKNEMRKFKKASRKVLRMNGKELPPLLDNVGVEDTDGNGFDNGKEIKIYNMFHLFKKEYRRVTILFTFPWFSMNLVSAALSFGIKSLHGDFYTNLIVSNAIDIPVAVFPIMLPNLIGRKKSALICMGTAMICLLALTFLDRLAPHNVHGTVIFVLFVTARSSVDALWSVLALLKVESYPTVVRSLGVTWCLLMSRIGAIIAPFLIPDDANSAFISYSIMSILTIVSFAFIIQLPETRGKQLQDSFEPEP